MGSGSGLWATRLPAVLAMVLLAAAAAASGGPVAGAASTGAVTVSMSVPSVSTIDPSSCLTGAAGRTTFGAVPPGTSQVTTLPCSIGFGSSNDTSMLRAFQADTYGSSMFQRTAGAPDTLLAAGGVLTWDAASGNDYNQHVVYVGGGSFVVVSNTGGAPIQRRSLAGGVVDGGFGTAGTTDYTALTGSGSDDPVEVMRDSAGRIVIVGYERDTTLSGLACRLTPNGLLDATFGGDGCINVDSTPGADDIMTGIVELPDRSYVLSGATGSFTGNGEMLAVHLREDGSQDMTWGTAGWWRSGVSTTTRAYTRIARQASGRLLLYGDEVAATRNAVVYAVTASGTTEGTWAASGKRSLDPNAAADWARTIVLDSSDRIYTSYASTTGGAVRMHVTRLTADGTIDLTWGASGTAVVPGAVVTDQHGNHSTLGFNALFAPMVIDELGTLTGTATTTSSTGVVYRMSPTGLLDASLDTDGVLVVDPTPGTDRITGMTPASDGRILLAGYRADLNTSFLMLLASGSTIPPYEATTNTWAGAGAGLFGACLLGGSNIATGAGTWTADVNAGADCADGDTDPWRPVVATNDATALVARSSGSGQAAARADLHFGLRVDAGASPGTYMAPITFEVLAPSV